MKDFVYLGPVPFDEDCTEISDPDYKRKALAECERYCNQLRKQFPIPEHLKELVSFEVVPLKYPGVVYYEVALYFSTDSKESIRFHFNVLTNQPASWLVP